MQIEDAVKTKSKIFLYRGARKFGFLTTGTPTVLGFNTEIDEISDWHDVAEHSGTLGEVMKAPHWAYKKMIKTIFSKNFEYVT